MRSPKTSWASGTKNIRTMMILKFYSSFSIYYSKLIIILHYYHLLCMRIYYIGSSLMCKAIAAFIKSFCCGKFYVNRLIFAYVSSLFAPSLQRSLPPSQVPHLFSYPSCLSNFSLLPEIPRFPPSLHHTHSQDPSHIPSASKS